MNAPLLSQHGPKTHSLSVLHVQVILYELPANLQSIFYQWKSQLPVLLSQIPKKKRNHSLERLPALLYILACQEMLKN